MKECIKCRMLKLISCFKPGAAICTHPCTRMLENIYRACKKENCLDYWEKIKSSPAEEKKAMRWYQVKCPPKEDAALGDGGRQKSFPILQYSIIDKISARFCFFDEVRRCTSSCIIEP